MRKLDLLFDVILVPVDYLALTLAASFAYALRFSEFVVARRPVMFALQISGYLRIAALIALGWIIIYALSGLYTIGGRRKKFDEFKKLCIASTAALGGVLAVLVFSRALFESRFILLVAWASAIVFVGMARLLLHMVRSGLLRVGIGAQHIAVVGQGSSVQAFTEALARNRKYGLSVIFRAEALTKETEQELRARAAKGDIDQIIGLSQNGAGEELHKLLDIADEYHIPFRYSAEMFATHGAGLEFDMLAGVPLMEIKRTKLEGWGRVYKRIFDIVGSIVLIVITSPIMLLAALAVVLGSGIPVIFKNERAGEHGKIFNTLKFRTMYQKYSIGAQFHNGDDALAYERKLIAEQGIKKGPVYKIKDDPRITRVGRFLRRASIDELPQLFNVLLGTMSLVGPRPHQPREVEKYEKHHKRVLAIKPGITGMPQISGRSDLSFEEEIRLDTYYMEHWSLKLDFIILLKTPFAVLGQKGTY